METLQCPDEFPFPFNPYPIQHDFMRSLYKTLEEGKLGIFESPTGTVSTRINLHTHRFQCWPDVPLVKVMCCFLFRANPLVSSVGL